jgi:hypothetical protein
VKKKQNKIEKIKEAKPAPIGRPSKYDPALCDAIKDYFNQPPFKEKQTIIRRRDGSEEEKLEKEPVVLPTLERFAAQIGVHRDTLHEWSKVHEDFSDAIKVAKELQKDILMTNGLMGLYNPTFAIFTAKNITDMRDVVNQELTGKDGAPLFGIRDLLGKDA